MSEHFSVLDRLLSTKCKQKYRAGHTRRRGNIRRTRRNVILCVKNLNLPWGTTLQLTMIRRTMVSKQNLPLAIGWTLSLWYSDVMQTDLESPPLKHRKRKSGAEGGLTLVQKCPLTLWWLYPEDEFASEDHPASNLDPVYLGKQLEQQFSPEVWFSVGYSALIENRFEKPTTKEEEETQGQSERP